MPEYRWGILLAPAGGGPQDPVRPSFRRAGLAGRAGRISRHAAPAHRHPGRYRAGLGRAAAPSRQDRAVALRHAQPVPGQCRGRPPSVGDGLSPAQIFRPRRPRGGGGAAAPPLRQRRCAAHAGRLQRGDAGLAVVLHVHHLHRPRRQDAARKPRPVGLRSAVAHLPVHAHRGSPPHVRGRNRRRPHHPAHLRRHDGSRHRRPRPTSRRVRALGVIDLPTLQKKLNLHYTLSLDLFGSEVSTNAANAFNASLKGRFHENRIDDDHRLENATYPVLKFVDGEIRRVDEPALTALNMRLRDDYCGRLRQERRALEQDHREDRRRFPAAASRTSRSTARSASSTTSTPRPTAISSMPPPGRARRTNGCRRKQDGDFIAELMKPVREPGQFAGWIAAAEGRHRQQARRFRIREGRGVALLPPRLRGGPGWGSRRDRACGSKTPPYPPRRRGGKAKADGRALTNDQRVVVILVGGPTRGFDGASAWACFALPTLRPPDMTMPARSRSAAQHDQSGELGVAQRQADRGGLQRLLGGVVGRQGARHQPDGQPAAVRRARHHGDLVGGLRGEARHLSPARWLPAAPRGGERHGQCGDRRAGARGRTGDRRCRARSAVTLLRHGRDPGAAVRRGRAQEHRALHGAAREGVGQARSRAG